MMAPDLQGSSKPIGHLHHRYLLLIRHGSVERSAKTRDEEQGLDPEGVKSAYEIASALGEQLEVEGITSVSLWCSTYRHANEHAGAVEVTLTKRKEPGICVKVAVKNELSPSHFRHWSKEKKECQAFAREIKSELRTMNEEALLLVGHQPQLGWLCEQIHRPIAIGRSEVVCLAFNTKDFRTDLLWTIAPTDKEAYVELRDKVKSKMETAKLLGTLVIFLLGSVLGILSDTAKLKSLTDSTDSVRIFLGGLAKVPEGTLDKTSLITMVVSLVCIFLAAVFYLMTMYAYDRLLMPTRFWSERMKRDNPGWLPRRPPSSNLLVLQVNMMRIWRLLFTPATVFLLLGMLGFAFVVMRAHLLDYILGITALGLCVGCYYNYARPRLGTDD